MSGRPDHRGLLTRVVTFSSVVGNMIEEKSRASFRLEVRSNIVYNGRHTSQRLLSRIRQKCSDGYRRCAQTP
jgi:hypothetical protein